MLSPRGDGAGGLRPLMVGATLALALGVLVVLSGLHGSTVRFGLGESLRGTLAAVSLGEPLEGNRQLIYENLLSRTVLAAGVGAALALSGAFLQGVFRNGLASPSLLGVTSGASLGVTLGIMVVGGYATELAAEASAVSLIELGVKNAPLLVAGAGFAGALAVALLVVTIGAGTSVATLLLVGIAVNACIAGVLSALQAWLLRHDWQISEAVFHWSFGSVKDKGWTLVALVWIGVALSAAAIPFVARELDLLAAGEEDAEALGVNTARVKLVVLAGASLSAASAVAVAGQIAFVGLVVPHLLRLVVGPGHRGLLPLALLGGAVFLLGTDVAQRLVLGREVFQPGVLMSVVGGPFFLFLLVRHRREVQEW